MSMSGESAHGIGSSVLQSRLVETISYSLGLRRLPARWLQVFNGFERSDWSLMGRSLSPWMSSPRGHGRLSPGPPGGRKVAHPDAR